MSRPTPFALNEIHLGDCLEWLRCVPDDFVDCLVSSPPYNIGKEYETRRALDHYLETQGEVLAQAARALKPTGSLFWQVGSYTLDGSSVPLDIKFFPILESLGLIPRNRIIWVRPHGLHAKNRFSGRHETILWFTKSDTYKFDLDAIRVPQKYQNKKAHRGANKGELTCNPLGKNPGDIWLFQNVKHNHEEQTVHPAQFPEDMVARMVLATTEPGDVVLDPYMGTGTVAVVARDTERAFIGAELDDDYHQIALRRLSGEPNDRGEFPNLKTLRQYCERTGEDPARFRFDVQTGRAASAKAKRLSEEHHLAEFESRLALEDEAFGERLRGISDGRPDLDRHRRAALPTLFEDEAV